MITNWEKADIISKMVIGIAGILISAALAYSEFGRRGRDEVNRNIEFNEKREEALIHEFQTYYSMVRASKDGDKLARLDLDLAGTVAQALAHDPFHNPSYNDAVIALRASRDPLPPKSGLPPSTLQASETTEGNQPTGNDWFAVIASFPSNAQMVAEMRARLFSSKLQCVEVWKTRSNNVYAVVTGGKTSRAQALANAQIARDTGGFSDAFTQADRDWTQITHC